MSPTVHHSTIYFEEVAKIAHDTDSNEIEVLADTLADVRRDGGRLFFLGVGGSAANASHAVNDFRKLCGIESYCISDNVAELSARANDEGWDTIFSGWLSVSKLCSRDALFVLSVGGGSIEKNVSVPIVNAVDFAKSLGTKILGIAGRDGGYLKKAGDHIVLCPTVSTERITPHSEAFQAVVWHALVSNPKLQINETKW